jgi:hypothetical protein
MQTPRFLLATLAGLSTFAAAQEFVVPQGMANTYTGNTASIWRSTAFRFQMLYDTTHFVGQGLSHPISINRLRFRPINGATTPGGQVYSNVTIAMSSSPSDYNTMSTTFATNVGADVVTVFNGNVTMLPALGGTPNDYYVDVTLTTPFVYNPETGLDLCVDVTAPTAPSPTTVPNTAASSDRTLHFARRLSTGTPAAATGALSDFAAVIRMDYTIPAGTGLASQYGASCYNNYVSFYENSLAGTFDLGGSVGVTNSIALTPNGAGGYTVAPGSNQWYAPTSANLALGDDAISAPQALPSTLSYPGGSTSSIVIESNGNVWLQPPTHTSFIVSTGPASLLSRGAVLCPNYDDLDPSATGAGTIHFDVDAVTNVAYATWLGVPTWIATPPPVRPTNTFQVAIFPSGVIEFRYQEMDSTLSWTATMCGFSPGAQNRDPGNRDISATMPFSTATDLIGLTLAANGRPVTGTTPNVVTSNVPGTGFSALLVNFSAVIPGIELGFLGMPNCYQNVALAGAVTLNLGFTSPWSQPFGIPNDASYIGANVFFQSVAFVPGVNPMGALSSNGLRFLVGNL